MAGRLPQLLRTHRAALKTTWLRRLRALPPVSALARVEILAHHMDETLAGLEARLKKPEPEAAEAGGAWCQACTCGHNPWLDYFSTGAEAAAAVLGDLTAAEHAGLRQCWHGLARHEIEALCAICHQRGVPCAMALSLAKG